jgi:hypothetical protein
MALGIVASFLGLGVFCWLLFNLTVYAAPCFAGMSTGLLAYNTGAGAVGAVAVGLVAGTATLILGQFVFDNARSPIARAVISAVFAAPAALAGYHATLGLMALGAPSDVWRHTFAIFGAFVVGATAWARMTSHQVEAAR